MLSRNNLHEYQNKAVNFIIEKKRCALFLDMGLGKTVSTLTAVSDLLDSLAVSRVLIIAPLRVANTVWRQEAENWGHLRHLRISVCTGGERNRIARLNQPADIHVINRENIKWLVDLYGQDWPYDMIVIDESSSFKSPKSQRFKSLKSVLHLTNYAVLLTGTPAPNGLLDLWSQMYLVDFGQALGRTMSNYKKRFFESSGYMGYKHEPRKGADEAIHNLISPRVISMRAEDYLELPERIDLVQKVELPPATLKLYLEFEKTLLVELDNSEFVEASTAAVLANKLLQWCNGAVYVDAMKNWQEVHKAKLDALADIVEDNAGENILVAYNYKTDLERLRAKFPSAVVLDNNPETVKKWNAGDIPMLLAHPASAGHGLNLQHGGALAVWFGLNWSLELYQQFNARLHRQGQTRPVRIVHIIVGGCLDERVIQVLTDKESTQSALIDSLKI